MNTALFIMGCCVMFFVGYIVGLIHGLVSIKNEETNDIRHEMNGDLYNGRSMYSDNPNDSNYKEFDHE